MKPCVFIHTNQKQYLGALVSLHSMKRNSRHADEFDVKLIEYETYQDFFAKYEGRTYSRDGDSRVWDKEDLQSFTPLRFMPPELMGYEGRAVVVDPDVFAVADGVPNELQLPIPENYYEDLAARFPLDDAFIERLRAESILYDRDGEGEFLHFFTRTINGLFFEVLERRNGYDRYGEANAPARLAAQAHLDRSLGEAITELRG